MPRHDGSCIGGFGLAPPLMNNVTEPRTRPRLGGRRSRHIGRHIHAQKDAFIPWLIATMHESRGARSEWESHGINGEIVASVDPEPLVNNYIAK